MTAARRFWNVPLDADVIAAPGASSLITQVPLLSCHGRVVIPAPTYNEHAAAFAANGWEVVTGGPGEAQVIVHPNNPDGHLWQPDKLPLRVIDESFCDVSPQHSLISLASEANTLVLKSFGKFWRLAGLRLGLTIGDPEHIAQLRDKLGP